MQFIITSAYHNLTLLHIFSANGAAENWTGWLERPIDFFSLHFLNCVHLILDAYYSLLLRQQFSEAPENPEGSISGDRRDAEMFEQSSLSASQRDVISNLLEKIIKQAQFFAALSTISCDNRRKSTHKKRGWNRCYILDSFVSASLWQLFWQPRVLTMANMLPGVVRLIAQAQDSASIRIALKMVTHFVD